MTECAVEDCANAGTSKGLCSAHYSRKKRHGDPTAGGPLRPRGKNTVKRAPRGAPRAFVERAARSETDECIIWPFAISGCGYGSVWNGTSMVSAPREVLLVAKGKPPSDEYHAAHQPVVCANRACCNPRHLRWALPTGNSADRLLDGKHKYCSPDDAEMLLAALPRGLAYLVKTAGMDVACTVFGLPERVARRILEAAK